MYLSDAFLYKTKDYGKTWTKIVNGIPSDDFTRTIRPDTKMKGLLFAGTKAHLYVSYNDGDNWIPFQLNLPNVPMTDLTNSETRRRSGRSHAGSRLLRSR
jgi:photosystem II stability/assembly factor-like uncharacterized protein